MIAAFRPMRVIAAANVVDDAANDTPMKPRPLWFLGLAVVIGIVLATTGFTSLLGSAANQETLRQTGFLAYFTAFTGGFTAASVVTEPLKKQQ